jgi:GTP-dependent phosphoenolpyruvate carboxykinase
MKPDKENTLSLLGDWARHHANVESLEIDPDKAPKMFVTVWAVFGAYSDALMVEIGDKAAWLDWYRLDCEMGAKARTTTVGNKTHKVKTLSQLANLIIATREELDD